MCQQLLTVNLDESVIGYKASLGVSQVYIFWKRLDIKLDKHV